MSRHTPEDDYDILSGQFYTKGRRLLREKAVQYERNWPHVHGGCYTARQDDANAWDAALAAYKVHWEAADGRSRVGEHPSPPTFANEQAAIDMAAMVDEMERELERKAPPRPEHGAGEAQRGQIEGEG